MDNILTYNDFVGEFNFDVDSESSQIFMETIIGQVQEKILIDLLGSPLYNEFKTAIESGTAAQKWLDLRDGATFTAEIDNTDIELTYSGLSEMLKYFTYYYFQLNITNKQTFAGKVNNNFENSRPADPMPDMIAKYNKGIELYGVPFDYNTSIVHFVNNWQLNGAEKKIISSCFNFLWHKNENDNTNYPNWYFKYKEYLI